MRILKSTVLALLVLLLNFAVSGTAAAQTRPNIIWMIADDIGFDLKSYQNSLAITPTLDKLAREGIQFWRFYTPSPICSPSRVGFVTGQHPAELGVYTTLHPSPDVNMEYNGAEGIPASAPTLFEVLLAEGYYTGHAGKWHRGSIPGFGPEDRGVIENYSFAGVGGRPPELESLFVQGAVPYYSQVDAKLVEWSVGFIERAPGPFYLEISFHAPHTPLHPPDEYLEEFSHLGGDQAPRHVGTEPRPVTPAQIYYGSVKQLDDNISKVIAALRANGLEDNTIILFSGDNGPGTQRSAPTSFNAYGSTGPFRGNKATIYEGGIRVPFIAKGPGFAKGVDIHEAISGSDLMPTLLSIIGIETNEQFYGEDVSHMFYGSDLRRTKPLHWITIQNRPATENVANRSPVLAMYDPATNIKCLMQPSGGRKEAYRTDLLADPAELNNLHRTSPQKTAACFESLRDWFDSLPPPRRFRKGAGKLYHFR
jgi:arylsulfatase A-like enzyme